MATCPSLLYAYPWMPFPRRVIIYLREKSIPPSLVTVVPVSDPQLGDAAPAGFPPRPKGSLPILVIPRLENESNAQPTYIRQSVAIMNYLDELCDAGANGFPNSQYSMRGTDVLSRARETELLTLADECIIGWNPIRAFGSGAGTIKIPEASKEMIRWIYRSLATIEGYLKERGDIAALRKGGKRGPTMSEIMLYQFLEFTKDCYGKDMTLLGEKAEDVYGREAVESYPCLREFYEAFGTRDSAKRDAGKGEIPPDSALRDMMTWWEGSV